MADSPMTPGRSRPGVGPALPARYSGGSWAPLAAGAVLAFALVRLAWPELGDIQSFQSPLAGLAAWQGFDKARDFRAVYLFLGTASAAAIGIWALLRRFAAIDDGGGVASALEDLLRFSLCRPAGGWGSASPTPHRRAARMRPPPQSWWSSPSRPACCATVAS